MTTVQIVLSMVAGFLFLAGYAPYLWGIFRGETKPAKSAWIIWALLDSLTLAAMYFKDAVNGQIVVATIGSCLVVVFAIKYGTPGWTKLDAICLSGAVLGLVLWQTFANPVLAIVISQCVVLVGSIPTFVSAWQDYRKENPAGWMLWFLSCLAALPAVPAWTLEDAAQPITFFIVESVMVYLLFVRPLTTRTTPCVSE